MTEKQVFLSYHHELDHFRASKICSMRPLDKSVQFMRAFWEEVSKPSDTKMKEWIDNQLTQSDCIIVLIGEETAKKQWINYTIKQAYQLDRGMAGIYIHRLLDEEGNPSERGENPFDYLDLNGVKFSRFVRVHDSEHIMSRYVYQDIQNHFSDLIDYAITNKPSTWKWDS